MIPMRVCGKSIKHGRRRTCFQPRRRQHRQAAQTTQITQMNTLTVSVLLSFSFLWPWSFFVGLWKKSQSIFHNVIVGIMVVLLGVIQLLQYYLIWFHYSEVLPKTYINSGTSLLFPLGLSIVLHVYTSRNPKVFRYVCISLMTSNCLIFAFASIMRFGFGSLFLPGLDRLWTNAALSKIFWGTIILLLDIIFMTKYVRTIRKDVRSSYLRVALPLLVTLCIDSMLFSGVVAYCDGNDYLTTLLTQAASKCFSGALYAACLTLAFKRYDQAAIASQPESAFEFWKQATPPTLKWLYRTATARIGALAGKSSLTGRLLAVIGVAMKETDQGRSLDDQTRAQLALERSWPKILRGYEGKWVALGPEGDVLASAESETEFDSLLSQLDQDHNRFIVRKIVPWLAETFSSAEFTTHYSESIIPSDSGDRIRRAEDRIQKSWTELTAKGQRGWAAFDENGLVTQDQSYDGLQEKLRKLDRENVVIRNLEYDKAPTLLGY